MIKISVTAPPAETLESLKTWQAEVDAAGGHAERVKAAELAFARRRTQAPFRPVLAALQTMCSGAQRCMYCEDSCGDEVEHHHPKAFYPGLVFAWENFLFACARCNRRKSTRFPLFSPSPPAVVELTRGGPGGLVPPPSGTSVLLDPRKDDPLAYFRLDLRDTFRFHIIAPKGTPDHLRADFTLRVLGLNERDELPRQRRAIYESHLSHLHRAAAARRDPEWSQKLTRIRDAVRGMSCGVVWLEMKRQQGVIAEVGAAFRKVPEAASW
jgi:5-methylcytosine-specific restriction endonuclease McrA